MSESNKSTNEIGALWEKTSGKGTTFFSGKLTLNGRVTDVVMFPNNNQTNPNAPAFRILLSNPPGTNSGSSGTKGSSGTSAQPKAPAKPNKGSSGTSTVRAAVEDEPVDNDDGIL